MKPNPTLALLLGTIMLALVCIRPPACPAASIAPPPDTGTPPFALYVLNAGFDELHLGYTREQSWPILRDVDLSDSAAVITEEDVDYYDWSTQTLVLTPGASSRFRDAPGLKRLDHRAFVVVLNGRRLYGGLFLSRHSAMAIKYPVIYCTPQQGGKLHLSIRPYHSIRAYLDHYGVQRIAFPGIRELFRRDDKLVP